MKKFLALFFALALCFCLFGCSSPKEKVKVKQIALTEESYAFAIAKENDQLENEVNEYLNEIIKSGELNEIINSFFNGTANFSYSNPASKQGCFVVATNAYFPPFEYYNGNKFSGVDILIAYNLAQRLGKTLYVEDMDFNAVIPSVQSGNCDIAMAGLTINEERLDAVDFSIPYYKSSQVLIVRQSDTLFDNCNSASEIEQVLLKQNNDYVVGAQNGTTGYMYIKGDSGFGYEGYSNLTTVGFTTGALAVRDLVNGRINAVIMDLQPGLAIADSINSNNFSQFFDKFITQKGYLLTLEGLKNTVIIAVLALLIGFIIGTIITTIKLIPSNKTIMKILRAALEVYITVLRGTPLLVQLLLCHFALFPAFGIKISYVAEAVVVFGLNSSAYLAEAVRAGVNSVDKGQTEAGRALGFSFAQTMTKIVLPQAIRNILPTLGNEFIALIKETSVANLIAVTDLTRSLTAIAESTYDYFIPYIVLALIYLILVMIVTALIKWCERRFTSYAK